MILNRMWRLVVFLALATSLFLGDNGAEDTQEWRGNSGFFEDYLPTPLKDYLQISPD